MSKSPTSAPVEGRKTSPRSRAEIGHRASDLGLQTPDLGVHFVGLRSDARSLKSEVRRPMSDVRYNTEFATHLEPPKHAQEAGAAVVDSPDVWSMGPELIASDIDSFSAGRDCCISKDRRRTHPRSRAFSVSR